MGDFFRFIRSLFSETLREWREDSAASIAAALAYYAIFSLSPLLLLLALFMGLLIGEGTAEQEVFSSVGTTVGDDSVDTLTTSIEEESSEPQNSGVFALMLWFAVVFWGASGAFGQLQKALNRIWEVRQIADRPFWAMFKDRLISFTVVMIAGLLLVVSFGINSLIGQIETGDNAIAGGLVYLARLFVSYIMIMFLIAWIFKVLPDIIIHWKDVWSGAGFTAFLFIIGQIAVSYYIGNSNIGSVYGAAGSLTVILVWIYYSAQILLFGAEFTEVWARQRGVFIRPDGDAEWIDRENTAREIAAAASRSGRHVDLSKYGFDEMMVNPSDRYPLNSKRRIRKLNPEKEN